MIASVPTMSGRRYRALIVFCVAMLLSSCDATAGALPPGPSPFPTLPRLPSVTPAPPNPSPEPTFPLTTVATITPVLLEGVVTIGANVRSGPGLTFAIIGNLAEGERVRLQAQSDGWYQIIQPDGTEGWMSSIVLDVPVEAPVIVPTVAP